MGENDVLNTVNVFNKGVTHARDILNLKQHRTLCPKCNYFGNF